MSYVKTKNLNFGPTNFCPNIFNSTKFNLNDRFIGYNPLDFCPKIKCQKLSSPKF